MPQIEGWNDPRWAAIYPPRFPVIEEQLHAQGAQRSQQLAQQQAQQGTSYIDRIEAAARAGAPMPNLSELPGFKPNMQAGADHA